MVLWLSVSFQQMTIKVSGNPVVGALNNTTNMTYATSYDNKMISFVNGSTK